MLHQRVDTKATRTALAGIAGTGEIIGYRGVPTLASWGRLPFREFIGIVAKIDSAEAYAPVAQLRRDLLLVGGLALLVVAATAAWLSRSLLGPLRQLTAGVKRFAAGDYEATFQSARATRSASFARPSTVWSRNSTRRTS